MLTWTWLFGYIFNLCHSVNLSHRDTPVKNHRLFWQYFEKQSASRETRKPGSDKKLKKLHRIRMKKLGQNLIFLGEIAISNILVLVSKTENRLKNSRSRLVVWDWKKINLDLVSMPEIEGNYSQSFLEAWDKMTKIIVLVSMCEIEYEKFLFSSRKLKNASRWSLLGTWSDHFSLSLVQIAKLP